MTCVNEIENAAKVIIERTGCTAGQARAVVPRLGRHPAYEARVIDALKLSELLGKIPRQARCPVPACSIRYRAGPDRRCPEHQERREMPAADTGQLMSAPGGDQRRAEPVARLST